AMDINVSLITYQDLNGKEGGRPYVSKVHFAGASLERDLARIQAGFADLTRKALAGGLEAIHAGIERAMTEPGGWRDDAAVRIMIVVGDEPGDSGDKEQRSALDRFPVTLPLIKDQLANLKLDPKALDVWRRATTTVYGIYTDPHDFAKFKHNLRM